MASHEATVSSPSLVQLSVFWVLVCRRCSAVSCLAPPPSGVAAAHKIPFRYGLHDRFGPVRPLQGSRLAARAKARHTSLSAYSFASETGVAHVAGDGRRCSRRRRGGWPLNKKQAIGM
eukprot:9096078-Alexandrium_andersonii.AAC.1